MRNILLLCILFFPTVGHAWPATVVRVHDGDTVQVKDAYGNFYKVRVYGIDCPELKQASGQAAREMTQQLLENKTVEIISVSKDKYKRNVAGLVLISDMYVLQNVLVSSGLAWVDDRYCKKPVCELWRLHQNDAKEAQNPRGLWAEESPVPPWEWRKAQKKKKK